LLTMLAAALLAAGPAPAADEPSKSHKEAAEALHKAMKMDRTMDAAIDELIDLQIKANPQLTKYKDVMKKFYNKHIRYVKLKDDFVKMYTEAFTEKELKDLTTFYKTPVGRKLLKKQPGLMQKVADLGLKKVRKNQAELQKMIEELEQQDD